MATPPVPFRLGLSCIWLYFPHIATSACHLLVSCLAYSLTLKMVVMMKIKLLYSIWDLTQVVNFKFKNTTRNSLTVFHQNIWGLQYKIEELTCMLSSHDISPQVICITEHYLTEQKFLMIKPDNYCLTSKFSTQVNSGGGVCIYCKSDFDNSSINITQFCIVKVTEACAAQLKIGNNSIVILCIYRSPCGNVEEFIKQLEIILKFIYKPKS
jgi:hypothetical protein